ncbi:hypothetical protein AVDCRST_MAG92-5595 [uncultured Coleofasciculus sp.]|jgi:hypothetical protein|uniref:Uncharacterized protein n=1 Tax=uncultured Coleofasciculus sp. TaxID=1267456 RepID=A0A6J4KLD9_9CYAN|nr:hypothetical protein AVDCRST_MAG92-5595 [uncultured Coleofasciculus sp.]
MKQLTGLQQQQYQRMIELSTLARQRYLEAGGEPRRASGSLHGNSYMTAEEKQEFLALGRQLSGIYVKDGYAHCQGRSWKLPENS